MSDSPKPLSLPGIEEFSKMLRTMLINIGFFAATLLLIPSIASQFTRSAIIIDPIAVPEAMVTQGLTPEVVANRVWDGLQEFAATASANREAIAAIPDSQLIEFSLPDAGVSIDSIFAQIRQFFQIYETRIGGEYVCATADCAPQGMQLRLRIVRKASDVIDLPPMGEMSERQYYREAAAGIYEIIDPYVAIAAQAETAPLKAATLARGLILDGGRDAKWAHNLVGDIAVRDNDLELAVAEYREALAIDADFHVAQAGLAKALLMSGDDDRALETLAELERRAPNSALVPIGRSQIAAKRRDIDATVAYLKRAAELEPLEPRHLVVAADELFSAGRTEEAEALLKEALTVDPGYGPALRSWAKSLRDTKRLGEAEQIYRQWLAFDPDNMEAHGSLGVILSSLAKSREALDYLDTAYKGGWRPREVLLSRAICLFDLQRYAEAAEVLVGLTSETPQNWQLARLLGQSYDLNGQRQEAAAAYQSFLDTAPADHANRVDAEAELKILGSTAP